jgi:methylmalonyl-CoA mutase
VTNDGFLSSPGERTDLPTLDAAFKASGAKLTCLCSSDKMYAQQAVAAAHALAQAGAKQIYFAGRPGDLEAALKAAGVKDFIHAGSDMLATLRAAHAILGSSA